ncbi:MAG: hemolysin family protein, partial [Actinomycetota bacterium]
RQLGTWLAARVPAVAPWSDELAMMLVVGATTYLSLVVGELVPKRLALHHAETIATRVAPAMRLLSVVGGPLVWLLGVSTEAVLRILGQRGDRTQTVTEDEVRALIAEGTMAGVFAPGEKRMLDRVLRLGDRTVGSIMTPRPDVVWLDAGLPPDEMRRQMAAARHTRLPVGRGSIDQLAGVLDIRDVLADLLGERPFDPMARLTQPPAVHETTPVPRLLDLFRQSGEQLAVVVDEYGSIEGIATVTDILEAIAGEMPEPGEADQPATRRADGSWLMDGGLGVAEVETLTGLSGLGDGGFHTLAGFILSHLEHLPEAGERLDWRGWSFEVVDMDGRRIDRVLVAPPATGGETADSGV